jgi:hypothetical protein
MLEEDETVKRQATPVCVRIEVARRFPRPREESPQAVYPLTCNYFPP